MEEGGALSEKEDGGWEEEQRLWEGIDDIFIVSVEIERDRCRLDMSFRLMIKGQAIGEG